MFFSGFTCDIKCPHQGFRKKFSGRTEGRRFMINVADLYEKKMLNNKAPVCYAIQNQNPSLKQ